MDMSKQRLQRIRDLEAENKALKESADQAAEAMKQLREETNKARKEVETLNSALRVKDALHRKKEPGEPDVMLQDGQGPRLSKKF